MMVDKIAEALKAGRELPPEKLVSFYDDWAKEGDYDTILLDAGYRGHVEVAAHLNKLVHNKDARILDVGSGTGLVGQELSKLGYTNICALDPSQDSLSVCREKGCYKDFVQCLIGPETPPFQDNTFDAAVSSGTFVPGHCDGASLKAVVRIVKPGGHFVIATRRTFFDDENHNYNLRQVTEELVADKMCSMSQEDIPNYSEGKVGFAAIYTVC